MYDQTVGYIRMRWAGQGAGQLSDTQVPKLLLSFLLLRETEKLRRFDPSILFLIWHLTRVLMISCIDNWPFISTMIFFLDNFLISPLVLLIPRLGLRLTLLFLFHTFLFSLDSPLISLLCCLVTTMNEFGFFIRSELIGGSLPSLLPPFLRFVHLMNYNYQFILVSIILLMRYYLYYYSWKLNFFFIQH